MTIEQLSDTCYVIGGEEAIVKPTDNELWIVLDKNGTKMWSGNFIACLECSMRNMLSKQIAKKRSEKPTSTWIK